MSSSRKGKGRQKVKMAKIENESNLQVTFSKRRAGLFKKASELSTLCGAETGVVVFSPGNKAHSFGHPNVDYVANRFLNQNVRQMSDADKLREAHQRASIQQQNMELAQLEKKIELEQKRAQELERVRKEGQRQGWFPPNLDNLNYRQLQQLQGAVLRFRHQLQNKVYTDIASFAPPSQNPSQPPSRVRSNEGASTSNASTRFGRRPNKATIPYDPMASESCPTIAYSSSATTPSEH